MDNIIDDTHHQCQYEIVNITNSEKYPNYIYHWQKTDQPIRSFDINKLLVIIRNTYPKHLLLGCPDTTIRFDVRNRIYDAPEYLFMIGLHEPYYIGIKKFLN